MKKQKLNPLFLLGFLGLIGFWGVIARTPVMVPYLLCFAFFGFYGVVPDELFWQNVRRAASRAFAVYAAATTLALLALNLRAMSGAFAVPEALENGFYKISAGCLTQYSLSFAALVIVFLAALCVFGVTLLHDIRKEKKYIGD